MKILFDRSQAGAGTASGDDGQDFPRRRVLASDDPPAPPEVHAERLRKWRAGEYDGLPPGQRT